MEESIRIIEKDAKTAMIIRESRIFREMNLIKTSKTARELRNKFN